MSSPSPSSSPWLSRVLYLGTGTSAQVPAIHCLLPSPSTPAASSSSATPHQPAPIACAACSDAILPNSKNRRGCTCVALIGKSEEDGEEELVLIDCGPTFYGSALQHFRPNGLPRRIAGVILTHGHADAVLGIDNLRAWTMGGLQSYVDVYLTSATMQVVAGAFPYLVDRSKATGGGGVGALRWRIIEEDQPFEVGGARVMPLPVEHGFTVNEEGKRVAFGCLGFRVDGFSYVSDCHRIPPSTTSLITSSSTITIDALMPRRHPSHFSLSQALSFLFGMQPQPPVTVNGSSSGEGKEGEGGGKQQQSLELGILTDLTHRLEHHALQRDVDELVRGLRGFVEGRRRRQRQRQGPRQQSEGDQQQQVEEKLGELKLRPNGDGDGEGPVGRWWAPVWDEEEAEQPGGEGRVLLRPEAGKDGEDDDGIDWEAITVPDIVVAFDGMVVDFDRETGRPKGWR